ncbi:MAG: hypothetical protein QGG73_10155, partial [Candidatus Hydrogenedentes bacterium]|nr:hypothetical protein [Candidatus Hydrogenedentota bacterium]
VAHGVEIFVGGMAFKDALAPVGVAALVAVEREVYQGITDESGKKDDPSQREPWRRRRLATKKKG